MYRITLLPLVILTSVACGDLKAIKTTPHEGATSDANTTVAPVHADPNQNPSIGMAQVAHAEAFPQAQDANWHGHIEDEIAWPAEGTIACHLRTATGDVSYTASNVNRMRTVQVDFYDSAMDSAEHTAQVTYDLGALRTSEDIVKVDNAVWGALMAEVGDATGRKQYFYALDITTMTLFYTTLDNHNGVVVQTHDSVPCAYHADK